MNWYDNAPIRQQAYERFLELGILERDIDDIMMASDMDHSFIIKAFWDGKAVMLTVDRPYGSPQTHFQRL